MPLANYESKHGPCEHNTCYLVELGNWMANKLHACTFRVTEGPRRRRCSGTVEWKVIRRQYQDPQRPSTDLETSTGKHWPQNQQHGQGTTLQRSNQAPKRSIPDHQVSRTRWWNNDEAWVVVRISVSLRSHMEPYNVCRIVWYPQDLPGTWGHSVL